MLDELKEEVTPAEGDTDTENRAELVEQIRTEGDKAVERLSDPTERTAMETAVKEIRVAAEEKGLVGARTTAASGAEKWKPINKDKDA